MKIEEIMITLEKRVKLIPFTPNEKEWSILTFLAKELDIEINIVPERGYRACPSITFNGIQAYIQKHISNWQTKIDYDFDGYKIQKGTKCQLWKGLFVLPNGNAFTCPRENTKIFLKPIYELFAIFNDRKISLTQIEKKIEDHPEIKDLLKQTFFNRKFYDKNNL